VPSGYVLSGFGPQGQIVYKKLLLPNDEVVLTLIFTYPPSEREAMDPVVDMLDRSFAYTG
jgi:hypothetical protein